jgi:hypothetical protein
MGQDAYVVTEDKVKSFTNYSHEFQFASACFFTFIGIVFGNVDKPSGTIFIVSAILLLFSTLTLWWTWKKYKDIKDSLFLGTDKFSEVYSGNLRILSAIYGTQQHTTDLASQLNDRIVDNKLNFTVSNSIGGDPHQGSVKTLKIRYKHLDDEREAEYTEGSKVELP